MDKTVYRHIESYMKKCMKDSAHDKEHIYRVLYVALDIAGHEQNVDMDVLIAACLLHDIGREAQRKDHTVCHAEAGSVMAYDFLLESGWPQRKADHVCRCILTHRFRNDRPPETLEARILFDADKIDATGAMGIARTLIYQGQVSHPLYTVDDAGRVLDGSGREPASFFREYKFKLEKLYGVFYTAHAQKIAEARRDAAAAFYRSLLKEAGECHAEGEKRLEAVLR